ncbi:bifunctional 4-hydroxy-2-oxoglutarate aldolase/2-dehydro-3-deoxy-phosphogluconate aldolase [Parahaliea mediterranea]|uniref:2-dehydro-3-deoxy-phosphogluconate aldolase n=1 Tax=Parahaliea mediterranea TaxID=651086 RepID=A0A939DEW5_9GAMM|nr:bifunctional 4-hydroxy-2-oxoglutarate aldolase/2-dehydro-3-deoxy-phosphogluconate aldolase [Parahaliea mediterranea]MBN7796794.1 bifunctional 4-hydroxy-2-oxoglutarate aldolase/2-dehydro-3-deoxy-phosphogluconate aldolase [Parahaliea mediterranea]
MIGELLAPCRVLPVITAGDEAGTVRLCRALAAAGMRAVEITLRTPAALDSLRAVKAELPQLLVAAGTVTNPRELDAALEAGADILVSPGATASLLRAAAERRAHFVPGVATASEVMQGLDHGIDTFKLFPAAAAGGIGLLKSLAGPFPGVQFCPTGGLTADNFRDYLALPNVVCCGGSWMVAPALVEAGDWDRIAALAADAMAEHNHRE